jgi:hypothetical protein
VLSVRYVRLEPERRLTGRGLEPTELALHSTAWATRATTQPERKRVLSLQRDVMHGSR